MGHRIYVDEQLTPAGLTRPWTITFSRRLIVLRSKVRVIVGRDSAVPAVSRCCEVRSAIRAESRLGMCAKVKFCPVVACRPPT